jgi:hypothetical protein
VRLIREYGGWWVNLVEPGSIGEGDGGEVCMGWGDVSLKNTKK